MTDALETADRPMILYEYAVANAAFRVRIALELKGIRYERRSVTATSTGSVWIQDYARLNPHRLVPTLVDGDTVVTQSIAIMEYLDETRPEPPLLPPERLDRAKVRALAMAIACDCQPLVNLRVREHLVAVSGASEAMRQRWMRHWMEEAFAAYECVLSRTGAGGSFSHGNLPTMADACLVPQVYMAHRFGIPTDAYPGISRVVDACMGLAAFQRAAPG